MGKCWREGENVGTSRGVVELLKLVVILLFFFVHHGPFNTAAFPRYMHKPLLVPILHPYP